MVFDVLVIAALVGGVWWWQRGPRQYRHAREGDVVSLLTYDDLPPIGAFDPLPPEDAIDGYVENGLEQLNSYLTERDQTA
jgi:hypothetical protein